MNLEQLAKHAYVADQKAEEAKKIADEAKTQFINALKEANKYNQNTRVVGNIRTKLTQNRYFDVDKATQFLTKEQIKECTVLKLDNNLVKQHLTPPQLEESMESYDNPYKLTLELNTETY